MSLNDGRYYVFRDGDYEAKYWAEATPDGKWKTRTTTNFTLSAALQAGCTEISYRTYGTEEEALEQALRKIQGETLWWRRHHDVALDDVCRGVPFRVLATRLGLDESVGWKCVVQYDYPALRSPGDVVGENFPSAAAALQYGKDQALHTLESIVSLAELSPGDQVAAVKARFVRVRDRVIDPNRVVPREEGGQK